nr:hypothetical protein [uncultured Rhodopila sp.]
MRKAAGSLLNAMPHADAAAKLCDGSWRGDRVEPGFVADTLTGLGRIDAALADRAVG